MKKENPSLEKRAANAILERPHQSISIGGRIYTLSPPSVATLILISELIATFPQRDIAQQNMPELLRSAHDYKALGRLSAILILGAKKIRKEERRRRHPLLRPIARFYPTPSKRLARAILEEYSSEQLLQLILGRIADMEIGAFFSLTTSLAGVNLLKATREVVPTTASGQSYWE